MVLRKVREQSLPEGIVKDGREFKKKVGKGGD